jgi:DNA-binding response OmpR family regulator
LTRRPIRRTIGSADRDLSGKLHREQVKAAVMMMTARGDLATVREALSDGADGYLVKPFGPQDPLKRIGALTNPDTFRVAKDGVD